MKKIIKPATNREVAEILELKEDTVKRYNPRKLLLMKMGLGLLKSDENYKFLLIRLKTMPKQVGYIKKDKK